MFTLRSNISSIDFASDGTASRNWKPRTPGIACSDTQIMVGNMNPTEEQIEAVQRFQAGGTLKINAFAGTGKTTTLQMLAQSTAGRGMYLAFNKSIADDAKTRFTSNVVCSTIHSLAFRATPKEYRHGDKMTGNLNANAFVEHLEYKDAFFGGLRLTARSQGHLARETLRLFMQGGRQTPDERHVPVMGKLALLPDVEINQIRAQALDGARRIWARMRDPTDALPLGHDGYLKLWALSRPELTAEFILLDEAQDTNPVVLGVLARQKAQIVYVGDRHQQIYEWRGAVNAMELIDAPHTCHLTTSFRFGESIASAASAVLRSLGETRPLTGNSDRKSFVGADRCDTVLARTNSSVMSTVISALDSGRTPHIVGGTAELIRMLRGVEDLRRGEPSDVSDFFGFANWNEILEFAKTPEGEQLKTFVSLVEQHGETRLITKLNQTATSERDADLVVSTAHKAKGREWETVELCDDFLPSRAKGEEEGKSLNADIDPAEARLFYVALTRARTAVQASSAVLSRFGIADGPRYRNPTALQPRAPAKRDQESKPGKLRVQPTTQGAATGNREPSPQPNFGIIRWWWLLPVAAAAGYFLR